MKVVCLSGGVGGAKLARGLYDVVGRDLTVVVNVGDDLEVLGLSVSPDLDSVLYALAGLNDEERGWGRVGETWRALESARAWGGDAWFQLGDLDLGLHLARTEALARGELLSAVTHGLTRAADVTAVDELVDLAVRVAGDVPEHGPPRRGFAQPMDRHDREELLDCPRVGHRLEY